MAEIKILKENGKDIIPVTHEKAVVDDNGVSLKNKLKALEDNKLELVNVDGTVDDVNVKGEDERIGELENLQTENKESIVGALNELFQDVDSGKQLIADAIDDESITKDSTFGAMSEAITNINSELSTVNEELSTVNEELTSINNEINSSINNSRQALTNYDISYDTNSSFSDLNQSLILANQHENGIKTIKGHHTAFMVKKDGTIWGMGFNQSYQLGIGSNYNAIEWTKLPIDNVKDVFYTLDNTIVLKNDNTIWGCGKNQYGELGLGHNRYVYTFTKLYDNVETLSMGETHTVIKTLANSLYSTGRNNSGQLCQGDTTDRNTFTHISTNASFTKQIACSSSNTYILKANGDVYSAGGNAYYQLATGSTDTSLVQTTLTKISSVSKISYIDCGDNHVCALDHVGTLYTAGDNTYGQLGRTGNAHTFTSAQTKIKKVVCGAYHTVALNSSNIVLTVGANSNGQLGNSNTTGSSTFINTGKKAFDIYALKYSTFYLGADCKLYACGKNNYYQLGFLISGDQTSFIDTQMLLDIKPSNNVLKSSIISALTTASIPFMNTESLTKLVRRTKSFKKICAKYNSTVLLDSFGTLWVCGFNLYNQLALDPSYKGNEVFGFHQSISGVKDFSFSGDSLYFLKYDNSLWVCGRSVYGQLGLGDTTTQYSPVRANVGNISNIKEVACGKGHTFIITETGKLYASGSNSKGQLGLGDTTQRTTFTYVSSYANYVSKVACGDDFSFILQGDGQLYACGNNQYGQLGLGDTNNRSNFTKVTSMGSDVQDVCCGMNYTYVKKKDGTIWCCGSNSGGQLCQGDTTNRNVFTKVNVSSIDRVVCGGLFVFFIGTDKTLKCCGSNYFGQLGVGSSGSSATKTSITSVTSVTNVIDVTAGDYHTIVLTDGGICKKLYACGNYQYGQLGISTSSVIPNLTEVI